MVLEVAELLLDAIEIEVVADKLLIDFAEELMIFVVAEPLDPPTCRIVAEFRFLRHGYSKLDYKPS